MKDKIQLLEIEKLLNDLHNKNIASIKTSGREIYNGASVITLVKIKINEYKNIN